MTYGSGTLGEGSGVFVEADSEAVESREFVDGVWHEWFTPPRLSRESARDRQLIEASTKFQIAFGDVALQAYAWGDGPTVLLMHGWGGRASQFASIVNALVDAGLRAVAVDAPAHGRTDGRLTNLFEFSDVVRRVAEHEHPPHAIIAHSMGAASATIALARGTRVGRVVLIAPICRLRDALSRFVRRRQLSTAVEEQLVARMEARFGPHVWIDSALDEIAQALSTPALLFHDQRDSEIPYADSVRTAAAWRGSTLVTTSGIGHRSLLRHRELISRAVAFVGG